MTEALIVLNDEAFALAHELAERAGTTVDEAVVTALQELDRRVATVNDDLTPTQRAERDVIRALVREARAHRIANVPTDHDYLYDEYGLPV
ncbi:type II toxin-antitoxin system VapB family antitoxin [Methylobacterium sp. HMF5984]|uniref:type II toxin-antitoxin system VapB family antitoxin n=1 Tax=Methylobacterium sp. HMF5984 TaxID=3367370 RepID=UPI0038541270